MDDAHVVRVRSARYVAAVGIEGAVDSLGLTEAIEALQGAADSPSLRREPLSLILRALALSLCAQGKVADACDKAVVSVLADREAIPAEVYDRLAEVMSDAAFRAHRMEANRMVRTFDRRTASWVGLGTGAAFVAGAAASFGLMLWLSAGPFSRDAQATALWHDVVRDNPDPRPALAGVEIRPDPKTGRPYYVGPRLWAGPAPSPPATAKP